eukprot:354921-Chlamydomonas_euryale.AAC.7
MRRGGWCCRICEVHAGQDLEGCSWTEANTNIGVNVNVLCAAGENARPQWRSCEVEFAIRNAIMNPSTAIMRCMQLTDTTH